MIAKRITDHECVYYPYKPSKEAQETVNRKALLKNLNGFSCDQSLWSVLNDLYLMIRPIGDDVLRKSYTIKPVYKDTEGAIESVRIKRVEFREIKI